MISCVIVDDMPHAVQMLEADLAQYCQDIEVIGTANSVVNAAKLLRAKEPDILFLDISLGDGTGFDLLEIFPLLTSKVIFVTASEEYAIKAFKFAALDYLLKPFSAEDLMQAVAKAKKQLHQGNLSLDVLKETIKNPHILPTKLSLHSLEKVTIVTIDDIVRCESDVNNTKFFMINGDSIYVTKTLKQYEELLKDHNFVRVHQSHLVHFKYVQEFIKKDGGYLKLKNGHEVPVSVRKRADLMSFLDGLS